MVASRTSEQQEGVDTGERPNVLRVVAAEREKTEKRGGIFFVRFGHLDNDILASPPSPPRWKRLWNQISPQIYDENVFRTKFHRRLDNDVIFNPALEIRNYASLSDQTQSST